MSEISNTIDYQSVATKGREFLDTNDTEACLKYILPILEKQNQVDGFQSAETNNFLIETLQIAGEALLEQGNPQEAYALLQKAVAADPTGEKGGFEKFLWLGQLTGSREGLEFYQKGIECLKRDINIAGPEKIDTSEIRFKRKKLSDAFCAMIEIWMTDLCMEPEAEKTCESLITEAMLIDECNPESWSVLGSIRISQQRNDDAKNELSKSWDLYHQQLENSLMSANSDQISDKNTQLLLQEQQQQLIPSLIRLAQNSFEVELFKNVVEITAEIQKLDDQVAESYYLHGLSRFELYKQVLESTSNERDAEEKNKLVREANKHVIRAKYAWETLLKLAEEESELVDPELAPAVQENLKQLPEVGPDDYDSSDDEDEENIDSSIIEDFKEFE